MTDQAEAMVDWRQSIDTTAAGPQTAGTQISTTGIGTFNQPDPFMFGYSFLNMPVLTYGAQLDAYDPGGSAAGRAIVSQGYTYGWIIDDQGLYIGAYIGVRIIDCAPGSQATHHFHFREMAAKNALYSPNVPASYSTGTFASPATADGTVLSLAQTTQSDGVAPSSSPTPTVTGGMGSLFVTWTPITNPTPVTYDVHVNTSNGSAPGSGDLVASVPGSAVNVTALQNGTALTASGGPYYVAVVARDADGSATASAWISGTPRTASNADIDANYVYANVVQTNQLQAGTVNSALVIGSSIATATTGSRVVMDQTGLHMYDSNNGLTVDMNTQTGSAAFAGKVSASTLTVSTGATFFAPVEIASSEIVTLDSSYSPGRTVPYPTVSNYAVAHGLSAQTPVHLYYDSGSSTKYAYYLDYSGNLIAAALDANGAYSSTATTYTVPNLGQDALHRQYFASFCLGGAYIGGYHWWLVDRVAHGVSGGAVWVTNNPSYISFYPPPSMPSAGIGAGTSDGTSLITTVVSGTTATVYKSATSAPGTSTGTTTCTIPTDPGGSYQAVYGMYYGTADLGATSIVLAVNYGTSTRKNLVFNTSGTHQASKDWYAINTGNQRGNLCWDSVNGEFWQVNSTAANTERFEKGSLVLGAATATWYSAFTWQDTANSATTTTSALSTGGAITSIPVTAIPNALPSGANIVLTSGTNTQTFVTSSTVSSGATSIPVTSQTPNFAYPIGTLVGTYETLMSTIPYSFTMYSRAVLTLAGAAVSPASPANPPPNTPNYVEAFYLGTSPTRTSMWVQGTSGGSNLQLATTYGGGYSGPVFSGNNPPATSTFPASTPASLVSGAIDGSSKPLIQFNGDGTWRLGAGAVAGKAPTAGSMLIFDGAQWVPSLGDSGWITMGQAALMPSWINTVTTPSAGFTTTVAGTGLTSGSTVSSISISASPVAIPNGSTVTITDSTGTHSQTFTMGSAVAIGATTVTVSGSPTANYSYPVGSTVAPNAITAFTVNAIQAGVPAAASVSLYGPSGIVTTATTSGALGVGAVTVTLSASLSLTADLQGVATISMVATAGWTAPSYVNSFTDSTNYKTRFRVVGNTVYLHLAITKAATSGSVFTLPTGATPTGATSGALGNGGTTYNANAAFFVDTHGLVQLGTSGLPNNSYYGSMSYPNN